MVRQVQEMPGLGFQGRVHWAAAFCASISRGRLVQQFDALAGFGFGQGQRRQHAHHIVAGRQHDQAVGARQRDEGARIGLHLQPDHQALAAHAFEHVRMGRDQRAQLLVQIVGDLVDMIQKARLQDHVDGFIAHRHGQRIAAIGGAMGAHGHALGGFGGGQHRADGKAAAQRLGHRHDVGRRRPASHRRRTCRCGPGPVWISSKISSRPWSSHSLRRPRRKSGAIIAHAAFALHRFDQDGGGLGPDRLLHRLQIAGGKLVEARHARAEAFQIFLIAAGIDGGIGAAVKGALEGDDVEAFGMAADEVVAPRHLDGELDRLGARIGEEAGVGEGVATSFLDRLSCPGTR